MTGISTEAVHEHRRQLISSVLAECFGGDCRIASLTLAAGGNSRETWIVDVEGAFGERRVVFRCDPDHWIRPEEMRREIDGLTLAEKAGVPAPRLLLSSDQFDAGRPFVLTEYVAGTAIGRRVARDAEYADARRRFASQCGRILAALHGAAEHAKHWPAIDPLEDLESHRARAAYPSPVLAGALAWLRRTRPTSAPFVPVHRDFRLGNLMVDRTGVVAVLDWETCGLSDPYEDLAWLCSRAWRYASAGPVGGIGRWEDLLEAYSEHSGNDIDLTRLHWWRVYGATRWGLACGATPKATLAGDAMEEAAVARQVCRQEYNVLLELEDAP